MKSKNTVINIKITAKFANEVQEEASIRALRVFIAEWGNFLLHYKTNFVEVEYDVVEEVGKI